MAPPAEGPEGRGGLAQGGAGPGPAHQCSLHSSGARGGAGTHPAAAAHTARPAAAPLTVAPVAAGSAKVLEARQEDAVIMGYSDALGTALSNEAAVAAAIQGPCSLLLLYKAAARRVQLVLAAEWESLAGC